MFHLNVIQLASTAGNGSSPLLHTPTGGKLKLKWDKERWRLKGKSARFGSILKKKGEIKGRVSAVYANARIYTFGHKPARRASYY